MKVKLVDLDKRYKPLRQEIRKCMDAVVKDSEFINGEMLECFENLFALHCGVKFGCGCSNGTSAIYLALKAIGLKPGDEVITVPNTFIATTEAITMAGGEIRFVDVDPDTLLMDPQKLDEAISPKTKAIIPVHLYGQMADMREIIKIAYSHGLKIIEDAAQAHGARHWEVPAPYLSQAATYSFFPGKIMGCWGDAGIVVTNKAEIIDDVRLLANHGRKIHTKHSIEGFNFRMDTIQAAVLLPQLQRLNDWVYKRRVLAFFYNRHFKEAALEEKGLLKCPVEAKGSYHAYANYVIRVPKYRDKLRQYLYNKGIETGIHYPIPLHLQPAYARYLLAEGSFPVAEQAAKEILSLPIYPEMSNELSYVATAVIDFFKENK